MDKPAQSVESSAPHEHDSRSTAPNKAAQRKSRSLKSTRAVRERPISVRFEPEIIERLDRVATQLSTLNVNIRIGRSSVVKLAMDRALAVLETELAIARADAAALLR